jgi:photosystem II stability/assembly factor-like uncharacterized protein
MKRRPVLRLVRRALLAASGLGAATTASAQTLSPSVYQALPFRYVGPPGNRINAVAGVAGDANVIYAGTPSGGIFKSVDAGAHWHPVFDDQHVMSIGALAVARSDANVVWAGTGDPFIRPNIEIGDGIYKSTDAGKTWSHMGLDLTGRIGRVAIDPRNPQIVFVAAMGSCYGPQQERGVFRTRDGGKTWERVLFVDDKTGAIDVQIDPTNPRVVFAATWQLDIHPWFSESGGPGSGIYKSTDGGTTWTRLTGHGLPDGPMGRVSLAIAPSNTKRIWALIETESPGNLWKSDDGGANWTVASRDANINRRARYFNMIGVEPDNPDELFVGAQALYHSTDAAATWTVIPENFPDHHNIWFDPTNANRIILANDRYVNVSTTRGRSWSHVNLPNAQVNRVAVDRRKPYNVYGSRQDGPAYRGPSNSLLESTGVPAPPGGTGIIPADAWVWTIGAESGWVIPDRGDENVVWVSSSGNVQHIDMSTLSMLGTGPWPGRGGAGGGGGGGGGGEATAPPAGGGGRGRGSVADQPFRRNWTVPLAMSPHDTRVAYAGSQFVHMSADGGRTWAQISPDLTTNDKSKQITPPGLYPESQDVPSTLIAIEESALEPGLIWTGSNDGVVSLTRDAGRTWTNVSPTSAGPWGFVNSVTPSRHTAGTAYVTIDRHRVPDNATHVLKTTDYGRTWTELGGGVPKSVFGYARVVREDPRRKGMLYLGTENALYVSVDDGASWLPLQNNLPHTPIAWVTVQEDFDDLVVACWGRGFWILDDISAIRQLTPSMLSEHAHLFAPRAAYEFALRPPTTTESFGSEFDPPSNSGRNPPYGAPITYYLSTTPSDSVRLTVLDDKGATMRTLTGPRSVGLNRVWWDLRSAPPTPAVAQAGRGGRGGGGGGGGGGGRGAASPLVAPGVYTIKLSVDGQDLQTKLTVWKDPNER